MITLRINYTEFEYWEYDIPDDTIGVIMDQDNTGFLSCTIINDKAKASLLFEKISRTIQEKDQLIKKLNDDLENKNNSNMANELMAQHIRDKLRDEVANNLINEIHILTSKELADCIGNNIQPLETICVNTHFHAFKNLVNIIVDKKIEGKLVEAERLIFEELLLPVINKTNRAILVTQDMVDLFGKVMSSQKKFKGFDPDVAIRQINELISRVSYLEDAPKRINKNGTNKQKPQSRQRSVTTRARGKT